MSRPPHSKLIVHVNSNASFCELIHPTPNQPHDFASAAYFCFRMHFSNPMDMTQLHRLVLGLVLLSHLTHLTHATRLLKILLLITPSSRQRIYLTLRWMYQRYAHVCLSNSYMLLSHPDICNLHSRLYRICSMDLMFHHKHDDRSACYYYHIDFSYYM